MEQVIRREEATFVGADGLQLACCAWWPDGVQPRGTFPNLTTTPMLHSQQAFDQIIHGARADKGMGDFSKDVGPEDSIALREYLIARANVVKERQPPPPPADNSGNQHQQ